MIVHDPACDEHEDDGADAAGCGCALLFFGALATAMFTLLFSILCIADGSHDAAYGMRGATNGAAIVQSWPTYKLGYWLGTRK